MHRPVMEPSHGLESKKAPNIVKPLNQYGPKIPNIWDIGVLIQIEEINPQGKSKNSSDLINSDEKKNINRINNLTFFSYPLPNFDAKKKARDRIIDKEITKKNNANGANQVLQPRQTVLPYATAAI